MKRGISGVLLVLIFVLGLGYLFQQFKVPEHDRSTIVVDPQVTPRRLRFTSTSPVVQKKKQRILPQCAEARRDYEESINTLRSDCRDDFIARSCDPPIEWPKEAMSVVDTTDYIRTTIEKNCPELASRVAMDCSAYPCSVVAEATSENDIVSCLDIAPDPDIRLVDNGLITTALVVTDARPSTKKLDRYVQAAKRRLRTHSRVLKQQLLHQIFPVLSGIQDIPSCPKSRDDAIPIPKTCEDLAFLEGCEFRPDEFLSQEDYQEYLAEVDSVLHDLETECSTFGDLRWKLDCDEVPCVIVLDAPPENWVRMMCVPDLLDGVLTIGLQDHAMLVPLHHIGEPDTQDSLRNRWERRSGHRYSTLIRTFDDSQLSDESRMGN